MSAAAARPWWGSMLTREEIIGAIRDAEDSLVLSIVATGATLEEFGEALDWLDDQSGWLAGGRARPTSRVAQIVALLEAEASARSPSDDDPHPRTP
jgi:hypothetical protein